MSSPPARSAIFAACAAFTIWGLSPLYFKAVGALPAVDIVAHRVLWSVLLLAAILAFRQDFPRLLTELRGRPGLPATLLLSATLNSCNWLAFVWAINTDRTLEASLGYFINPLVSVLLGAIFLGERLRRWQLIAVAIATVGVLVRIWQVGSLPWIALFLATTFGLYGLLRKRAPIDPIGGLFVETTMMLPLVLAYFGWLSLSGAMQWQLTAELWWLLPIAGLITTVPLTLFAHGARGLPLATLGFTQYLAPTLNFLLAVLVFREPFDLGRLGAFALIWLALGLYSADLWRAGREAASLRSQASGKIRA